MSEKCKSVMRRKLLKTVGAVGLATAAGVTSAKLLANSEEVEYGDFLITGDEESTKKEEVEQQHMYSMAEDNWWRLDTAIECLGGAVSSKPDWDWVNHFRLVSGAAARRYEPDNEDPGDGTKLNVIDLHELRFANSGTGNVYVDLAGGDNDPIGVGGWPAPEYTGMEILEEGLEGVAETAVSELIFVADYALQAVDFYENLSSAEDDHTTDFAQNSWTWNYGDSSISDLHSDIAHAVKFDILLNFGDSTDVYWDTLMKDGDLSNRVNWKVSVSAPDSDPNDTPTPTPSPTPTDTPSPTPTATPSPTPTDTPTATATPSPTEPPCTENCIEPYRVIENMSKREKERWGMVRVPVKKLKAAGVPRADEIPTYSDGTAWYATSPPVSFQATKTTTGK